MEIPVDKVELLAQIDSTSVAGETTVNEDDEEISIWDQVSDGTSIEQQFEMADSVSDLLQIIEKAFDALQERQKAIVSDMITIRKMDAPITEFDSGIWCGLVDCVMVYGRDDIKVTFKDGTEI